jgi:hypothetical protein
VTNSRYAWYVGGREATRTHERSRGSTSDARLPIARWRTVSITTVGSAAAAPVASNESSTSPRATSLICTWNRRLSSTA